MSMHPEHEAQSNSVGLEHQGTYVYRPSKRLDNVNEGSNKRRKTNHALSNGCSRHDNTPFVPLLNGDEAEDSVRLRYELFQELWSSQQRKIQSILHDVDFEVLENIVTFIKDATSETYNGRIPCGMISVGSNISSTSGLLEQLKVKLHAGGSEFLVPLDSSDASNLKNSLKIIIKNAVTSVENIEDYREYLTSRTGPRLLPYDLDLLLSCVRKNNVKKVVVAFKDCEAFDSGVLTDIINFLGLWSDRIPFVLLFGVATSAEYLESKLPRSTVKLLQGRLFDFHHFKDSIERIFIALQTQKDGGIWVGHGVSQILMNTSGDCFQSPEMFGRFLKYAYMGHFFANPLSVLLAGEDRLQKLQPELCEAIRNTPSFRRYVQRYLDDKDTISARRLIENDAFLAKDVFANIATAQQFLREMIQCVEWLVSVSRNTKSAKPLSQPECIALALSGELLDSKALVDVLEAAKSLNSYELDIAFGSLSTPSTEVDRILADIRDLLRVKRTNAPLRNKHDTQLTKHNTTVVGQRVKLTKGKARLSAEDLKYSDLVDTLFSSLQDCLTKKLISPAGLLLHECLIYDLKSPVRYTFTPRCRRTVERSLFAPFDYLEAREQEESGTLSASQPAISILYQLYLESGAVVNVYDLWRAFYMIVGGEDGDNCDERTAFSVFYQSLAELKMMGMAKISKKKTDHLTKSAWMGL